MVSPVGSILMPRELDVFEKQGSFLPARQTRSDSMDFKESKISSSASRNLLFPHWISNTTCTQNVFT